MVALHNLKHTCDLSEEAVVEGWLQNPYRQLLGGMRDLQHQAPIDTASMSRCAHTRQFNHARSARKKLRILLDRSRRIHAQTTPLLRRYDLLEEASASQVNADNK